MNINIFGSSAGVISLFIAAFIGCGPQKRESSDDRPAKTPPELPSSDHEQTETEKKEDGVTAKQTEGEEELVAESTGDQDENTEDASEWTPETIDMLTLSTTLTGAQGAARCGDILAQGIHNRVSSRSSDSGRKVLTQHYCHLDEGLFVDRVRNYLNRRSNSSHSTSDAGGGGLNVIGLFEVGGSGSHRASGSSASSYTDSDARDLVLAWRKKNCGAQNSNTSHASMETLVEETVEPLVVEAWRSCMNESRFGFLCRETNKHGLVSLSIEWRPNEVQRRHLPRVNLNWQGLNNIDASNVKLPQTLGSGSPVTITFPPKDSFDPTSIEVLAGDQEGHVSFGCSSIQAAQKRRVTGRSPQCGMESYRSGQAAVCGPKLFKEGGGDICGNPTYKSRSSSACPAALYQRGRGWICGKDMKTSMLNYKTGLPFAGLGLFNDLTRQVMEAKRASGELQRACKKRQHTADSLPFENPVFRVLMPKGTYNYSHYTISNNGKVVLYCSVANPKSCRDASFGVAEYRTCRHSSHGVESLAKCRHESFGVEEWNTCESEEFGVATYKECEYIEDNGH